MGSPANELGRSFNETQHDVTITRPFELKSTETTQAEWQALMGNNPSAFSACGDDGPVENVSWNDAVDDRNALSEQQGLETCSDGDRTFLGVAWSICLTNYRRGTRARSPATAARRARFSCRRSGRWRGCRRGGRCGCRRLPSALATRLPSWPQVSRERLRWSSAVMRPSGSPEPQRRLQHAQILRHLANALLALAQKRDRGRLELRRELPSRTLRHWTDPRRDLRHLSGVHGSGGGPTETFAIPPNSELCPPMFQP